MKKEDMQETLEKCPDGTMLIIEVDGAEYYVRATQFVRPDPKVCRAPILIINADTKG